MHVLEVVGEKKFRVPKGRIRESLLPPPKEEEEEEFDKEAAKSMCQIQFSPQGTGREHPLPAETMSYLSQATINELLGVPVVAQRVKNPT